MGQVLLHQCHFGRPYRKPTVFLTFGDIDLSPLALTCTSQSSCGRAFHTQLGFGQASTAKAVAYPAGLCSAYAGALHRAVMADPWSDEGAIERLVVTSKGVVERHVDRGLSEPSLRARRAAEDLDSRAGSLMKKGPNLLAVTQAGPPGKLP